MRAALIASSLILLFGRAASAEDGAVMPLPAKDQQELTRLLGPHVVGKALPSQTINDVSVYFPLKEKTASYRVTSGDKAGSTQTLRVRKGQRPNGNPAWRFELSPTLASFINEEAGGLVMPAVSDTDEGVVVVT